MRIMIVHPGFDYSTLAVAECYYNAFERAGYEVVDYDMIKALGSVNKDNKNFYEVTEFACSPITNQVINDRIDAVFMIHGYWMNPSVIISLRNLGVKTGLILTDDPMQVDAARQWAQPYEYVFSNDRNTVDFYNNGHYLPVAVDQTIFYPREVESKYWSGTLLGGSLYKDRTDFIDNCPRLVRKLMDSHLLIVGARKREFENKGLNKFFGESKVSIEEMSKYVAGAELVLDIPKKDNGDNVFGQTNKMNIRATCLSPRIFECFATGVRCLTSSYREDIKNLFPSYNIPTYDNCEHFADLLSKNIMEIFPTQLLMDLKDYTLKNHTYDNRVKDMEKIMDLSASKKDLRYSNPINNVVNKNLSTYWRHNFEVCKKFGYYTPERSVACVRTSTDIIPVDIGMHVASKALNQIDWSEVDIVSNGPSFENSIYKLKHSKLDCSRIYLNQAALIKETFGLPSGFGAVIHPNKDVYTRCFEQIQHVDKLPLFASTIADKHTIEKWIVCGGKVFFFNTGNDQDVKKEVFEATNYPLLGSGHTVAFSAITIALFLGAKKINFYGLDFCYLSGQKYAFQKLEFDKMDLKQFTLAGSVSNRPVCVDTVLIKSRDAVLKLIENNPEVEFVVHGEGFLYSKKLKNLTNRGV